MPKPARPPRSRLRALLLAFALAPCPAALATATDPAQRPLALVQAMSPGPLQQKLLACAGQPLSRSAFSIGHRGAPLGYPEHTRESYEAAAAQGAGVIECDVTLSSDGARVCRHAQCDLHSTTNILQTPLAARCREPFLPADPVSGRPASARCCASDLTLAEFRSLQGRNDRVDPAATTLEAWFAPGGEARGELMTHQESIALFTRLGVRMTPELKNADPGMTLPAGITRAEFARSLIRDYLDAGVAPGQVSPQSYLLEDLALWIREFPAFAANAVWLDGRIEAGGGFDPVTPASWNPSMAQLREAGIHTIAPPIPVLLSLSEGQIVPSAYARAARAAGLKLITWTLERSGPLDQGGGFYYASIRPAIRGDGDMYRVLDILVREVGITAIFSDWPATTTYYANCIKL